MTSNDPQVPIVPGQADEPPTAPMPVPTPVQPQQAQPVYYQPPPPQASTWNPGRTAGNTVVVVATIVGIVIGIPLLCCVGWLVFGTVLGIADRS